MMLLSRHGAREMILLTVILGAIAAAVGMLHWSLSIPFGVVWLCGLAFFRDPRRRIPADDGFLVAPADGIVTEITELPGHPLLDGPATRIGIFLSVLDVHVNRSPCAGRITKVDYQPGEFLDARHPECGRRNESNTLVIEPESGRAGPVIIRQVTGLIARRIVCAVSEGDFVKRGERFGMIKFGSRTELIVAASDGFEAAVKIGDRVWGGSSVLMQQAAVNSAKSAHAATAVQQAHGATADETHNETDQAQIPQSTAR
jgi:phosphatidylserine decarboxylase